MATVIHPTAIVEDGAQFGTDVTIGAYAYIGKNVKIGDGTVIQHHAAVEGNTTVGKLCEIFSFACLGKKTQDLKYAGAQAFAEIGDRNVLREFCTVNMGTKEGEVTRIGNDCLMMAYSHVAHGVQIGNNVVIANSVQLAGEVVIEDFVVMGGMSGAHQFVRIGKHSMVGGMTAAKQDVAPYMIVDGTFAAETRGVNLVGLQRRGFSKEARTQLKEAFRLLYREGLNRSQALERIGYEVPDSDEVRYLVDFYKASQRGVI